MTIINIICWSDNNTNTDEYTSTIRKVLEDNSFGGNIELLYAVESGGRIFILFTYDKNIEPSIIKTKLSIVMPENTFILVSESNNRPKNIGDFDDI